MQRQEGLRWVVWMGDFSLLKNLFSRKRDSSLWMMFGCVDALLRGFGQVVFANNPISGLLIIIAFALAVPGTLVSGAGTGFLGLLLSLLLRDTWESVGNGLTVYNPLLIGSVTHALAPNSYGSLNAFVILIVIVGTIFSVYLTKSLSTGRFPCITVPFNIVEITLLLILTMNKDFTDSGQLPSTNTSTELTPEGLGSVKNNENVKEIFINGPLDGNITADYLNWGMFFRGVVVSPSQVYAVDNVAVGSVIYLAIVVYSPITALFSLLGAFTGCLLALGLNVPYASIYAGLWGYNSLLTGAALGGLFMVMSGQTSAAAFVAVVFTTFFQYVAEPLLAKMNLPVLTLPFVVTAWLFFGLGDSSDGTFSKPPVVTYPEHHLRYLRSTRHDDRQYTVEIGDQVPPDISSTDDKNSDND